MKFGEILDLVDSDVESARRELIETISDVHVAEPRGDLWDAEHLSILIETIRCADCEFLWLLIRELIETREFPSLATMRTHRVVGNRSTEGERIVDER